MLSAFYVPCFGFFLWYGLTAFHRLNMRQSLRSRGNIRSCDNTDTLALSDLGQPHRPVVRTQGSISVVATHHTVSDGVYAKDKTKTVEA
jgi:hypothetical protein